MWWVRESMWDQSVELGEFDRWVITSRAPWRIQHWLEAGFVLVPTEAVWRSLQAALARVDERHLPIMWKRLFPYSAVRPRSRWELGQELTRLARDPIPVIRVLERLIERGWRVEPPVAPSKPLPARTQSEHYVAVQAVDPAREAVSGLRLEVLIADGEIRHARTDSLGMARVDRVQAGRVVIRVLDLDGALWCPLEGAASEPSGADAGLRWHVVRQGECLARIAHRYGLKGWKDLWDHPKNEGLRKKRESPHVLRPGDEVAIPGVQLHEITRPTDATHCIEVRTGRAIRVRVRVQDLAGEPIAGLSYEHEYLRNGTPIRRPGSAPTDANGWLEETIPIDADPLFVSMREPTLKFQVPISRLDPAREKDSGQPIASGIHMRLSALGYETGPASEALTPQLREAIAAFQTLSMQREAPTGEPDAETTSALQGATTV